MKFFVNVWNKDPTLLYKIVSHVLWKLIAFCYNFILLQGEQLLHNVLIWNA